MLCMSTNRSKLTKQELKKFLFWNEEAYRWIITYFSFKETYFYIITSEQYPLYPQLIKKFPSWIIMIGFAKKIGKKKELLHFSFYILYHSFEYLDLIFLNVPLLLVNNFLLPEQNTTNPCHRKTIIEKRKTWVSVLNQPQMNKQICSDLYCAVEYCGICRFLFSVQICVGEKLSSTPNVHFLQELSSEWWHRCQKSLSLRASSLSFLLCFLPSYVLPSILPHISSWAKFTKTSASVLKFIELFRLKKIGILLSQAFKMDWNNEFVVFTLEYNSLLLNGTESKVEEWHRVAWVVFNNEKEL